jgi:hypothetical protein
LQTANIWLALGGDMGTTVPKYGVTPSEVAVLRAIHGSDAVFDIEPGEDIDRSNREEMERLRLTYGHAKRQGPSGEEVIVATLFPGAAARAFQSFDELELDESLFKAVTRMKPKAEAAEPADKPKRGRKAKAEAADEEDDGVKDMTDTKVFE